MARRLGWSEGVIAQVALAISLLGRGASLTQDFLDGHACEGCAGRSPIVANLPCALCGRKVQVVYPDGRTEDVTR